MADASGGGRGQGRGRGGGGRGRGRGVGGGAGGSASALLEGGVGAAPPSFVRKGAFAKELSGMLYGFGDGRNAQPETVALVEDIVCDFIVGMVSSADRIRGYRARARVPSAAHGRDDNLMAFRRPPSHPPPPPTPPSPTGRQKRR